MGNATDGTSEPNVDPADRMAIEQLARVADLHVADVTGLSTSVNGRTLTVVPVNRTRWVQVSLDASRPLVEKLAGSLGPSGSGEPDDPLEIGRAHVCTPVTNAPLGCRLLLDKKNTERAMQLATLQISLR